MNKRNPNNESEGFVKVSALLFGKMKVLRYTLDDVIVRLPEQISRNTLCMKLRHPERFRLGELAQVCEVLGVEFSEVAGCI